MPRPRSARWRDASADLRKGTGWWSCANALTAVIRYTKLTDVGSHAGFIGTTFTGARRPNNAEFSTACAVAQTLTKFFRIGVANSAKYV